MKNGTLMKLTALSAAIALLLGSVPVIHAAADEVYFTAINDTLLKLDDRTMPFSRNGKYYMPYIVFNDFSLGVYYTYNKEKYTLTFYNRHNTLVFDLLQNYAYDLDQQYWESAIYNNDTLYIPIEFVCEEFGLRFSHISPTFSSIPILRVISESNLDDYSFQVKHVNRLVSERNAYYNTPAPSTSPSPSPAPDKPLPTQEPGLELKDVSLVFDCVSGEGIPAVLDLLDRYGVKAAFFLSEEVITADRDTVRRILGSDHRPGILLDAGPAAGAGDGPETPAGQAGRLNSVLDSYTCQKTRFVRFAPPSARGNRSGERKSELEIAGYVHVDTSVDTDDYTSAVTGIIATMNILKAAAAIDGMPVIRFDVSSDILAILGNMLRYFQVNGVKVLRLAYSES